MTSLEPTATTTHSLPILLFLAVNLAKAGRESTKTKDFDVKESEKKKRMKSVKREKQR